MKYRFTTANEDDVLVLEADVAPAAVLEAMRIVPYPNLWYFDGIPLPRWLSMAQEMFAGEE